MTNEIKAAIRYAEILEKSAWVTHQEQDEIAKLLRRLVMTKDEAWDASDMAHRTGGLSMGQEPVAWVRDLTSPSTHCVTSLKYLSIADTNAGVKYIPLYTAPPSKHKEQE